MSKSQENRTARRTFLMQMAAAGTATLLTGAKRVDANQELVIGVIGVGGQGRNHLSTWANIEGVRVAYVCDVDQSRAAQALEQVPGAKSVDDLRRILDDPAVNAVSIATPDHWHTPASLLALDAGKHVYVEKPCSHNVREGRMLVEAAKRTGLVVQHGTQSRSSSWIPWAFENLDGMIGDVVIAKAWNVQVRPPIGRQTPSDPPAGFDYESWLGPAPHVPFQSNRHHYSWHWWYNFGTGDAGNDGVHELDIARWGLGVSGLPTTVGAAGGKYVYDDDQEFPDTMSVVFEYPGASTENCSKQLHFEMRLWSKDSPYGIDNGVELIGARGRLVLGKRGVCRWFNDRGEELVVESPVIEGTSLKPHFENFVRAITDGETPHADALTAHESASLSHLANLSCRVHRPLHLDPASEQILNDEEANALLGRTYRDHWATPQI